MAGTCTGHSYQNDIIFDFGDFRRADRPIPTELRNGDWYHRRGDIQNYDSYPENQHGVISGLKDYANDDDAIAGANKPAQAARVKRFIV